MVLAIMLVPLTSGAFLFGTAGSTPVTVAKVEPIVLEVEKTYETEVARLALKYDQSESLARKIIFCESTIYSRAENKNYRLQWNSELGTSTMTHWSSDWGYWQVNDFYHEKEARRMGYNIYKWEDNLEYGFWLMSKQGTQPWSASRHCWNKQ